VPSRNALKQYVAGGIYHVYNRGVEKRRIFLDGEDYRIFTHYLSSYLQSPNAHGEQDLPNGLARNARNYTLNSRLCLHAFCLMPNHFHLLLKQTDDRAIVELMRRLGNAYVGYFNQKNGRVGPLFQGRYRAAFVKDTGVYAHLTRYIHRNPAELMASSGPRALSDYEYSSYRDYLGLRSTKWLSLDEPIELLSSCQSHPITPAGYREYVEQDDSTADTLNQTYRLD